MRVLHIFHNGKRAKAEFNVRKYSYDRYSHSEMKAYRGDAEFWFIGVEMSDKIRGHDFNKIVLHEMVDPFELCNFSPYFKELP